jgi:alpha-D-ribose 1-methylphosphonate 5-phosphate C-P lyase
MTKADQLLQVTADWEVSCLELEDVISKVQTWDEALAVCRHVGHLLNRLVQVERIARRRCEALSDRD